MRTAAALATLTASLGLTALTPSMAPAQDFVGFDRSSFGRVVLNRNQAAGANDITLELAIGDYNNEPILNYSPKSVFARLGLAVGRLDILTDTGVYPCTAFIVDDKHILTNHHCVPGILENERAGATRIDSVMFIAGYRQTGVEEGTRRFTVIPTPVETSKELDYSVLEVIGDPSAEFGKLELAAVVPGDNDPYWVIGHPMGEAQRISREKCRANSPALSGHQLLHTCDTLPGNSGSPVIDASLQKVVGLHHAGSNRDAVNYAIPMAEILAGSKVLKAAYTEDTAQPAPKPETPAVTPPPAAVDETVLKMCDALFAEAKDFGQCFAYEAYLEVCGEHTYAVLARSYLDRQCDEPEPAVPVVTPPVTPPPPVVAAPLRPWCTSPNLNPTERAICADRYLAGLDEQMEQAYASPARNVTASQQGAWRVGTRDRCGADTDCLSRVIIERITYLKTPGQARAPEAGTDPVRIKGNFTLTDGRCYIVTASRPTLAETRSFIQQWHGNTRGVRVFYSTTGYYGIVLETVSRSASDSRLAQLKSRGAVPSDSYCSNGERFVEEILFKGAAPAPQPQPQRTMYVTGTDHLNVRSGPGVQFGVVNRIDFGDRVTVFDARDGWNNIRLPNGQTGWVADRYLASDKPNQQPIAQCTATVVNLKPYNSQTRNDGSGFLNIRTQASTRGQIISETYLGDTLKVLNQSGTWAQVQCLSGQCMNPFRGSGGATGWASKKYLSIRCR